MLTLGGDLEASTPYSRRYFDPGYPLGQDLQIEYWALPGYEESYGHSGPVPLKPSKFYAGDEQPG